MNITDNFYSVSADLTMFYSLYSGSRLSIDFMVGRKDCNANNMPKNTIPEGHDLDTVSVLRNQFGLSREEAVALMGLYIVEQITNLSLSGITCIMVD